MPRFVLTVFLSACLATPTLAQQPKSKSTRRATPRAPISPDPKVKDISGLLSPIIREHKVPGMAAAIVKGWDTVALGVAGVRKQGERDRITIEDKWHLGSDTKAMTASLCGILVEEEKLRWDMTLPEAFPEVKMDPGWKQVTLEHLLTNRAGAPVDLNKDGLWQSLWSFKGTPTEARRALLEGVVKHPPVHEPGSKFLYSNAGFAIAGHIAETVMKTSWEELMTRRLFDRLQMFSVGYGAPGTPATKPITKDDLDAPPGGYKPTSTIDQPRGHRPNGSAVEPGPTADNPVAIGPAGIVHCTIGDWAKFIAMHLRGDPEVAGGAGGEFKLIRADTMKKMHTPGAGPPGDTPYAMGWIVTTRGWAGDPGRVLTHAGSNTMWYCTAWIAPEKDLAILITCNQGGEAAVKACDEAATMLVREAVK